MRILLPILAICFLPLILAISLKKSSTIQKCCVTVYDKINLGGASKEFCENVPDLGVYGWSDRVSSWQSNCSPSFFENGNYGGESISGTSNKDLEHTCRIYGKSRGTVICMQNWDNSITSLKF